MNFTPFSGHIPATATIPTIHQFAAKFAYDGNTNNGLIQQSQDGSTRYQQSTANVANFNHQTTTTAPLIEVNLGKFRQPENVLVSINNAPHTGTVTLAGLQSIHGVSAPSSVGLTNLTHQYTGQLTVPYTHQIATTSASDTLRNTNNMAAIAAATITSPAASGEKSAREYHQSREHEITQQDIMNTMLQVQQTNQAQPVQLQGQQQAGTAGGHQQLVVVLHDPKELNKVKQEIRDNTRTTVNTGTEFINSSMAAVPWQSLTAPGVADYLSLGLQHLLKYTGDTKRVDDVNNLITAVAANGLNTVVPTNTVVVQTSALNTMNPTTNIINQTNPTTPQTNKKKKKKKPPKEQKPRPKPGEIRLTTALDGSTLYCCPECHMAYPERGMLEQHLLGHTMERRYICDICNAALKRKDHLTRHKQSHNPERPYVCTVCLKAFKRKEQLTLHFVIHSGEKRHVCNECGKGFYRKDHLRKHTRSHIARRVKAELSQQSTPTGPPRLQTQ